MARIKTSNTHQVVETEIKALRGRTAKRSSLMLSSAIFGGLFLTLSLPTHQALAGCSLPTPGFTFLCADGVSNNAQEGFDETFTTGQNDWLMQLLGTPGHEARVVGSGGPAAIYIDNNFNGSSSNYEGSGGIITDKGTEISASGSSVGIYLDSNANNNHVYASLNGSISTEADGVVLNVHDLDLVHTGTIQSSSGDGIDVNSNTGGVVNLTNESGGSITGAYDGIYASGGQSVTVTNHGSILSTNSGAAVHISSGGAAKVVNDSMYSMIGATDGVQIFYRSTAEVDNQDGLILGRSGAGVNIDHIGNGSSTTTNGYVAEVQNSGGIILGSNNGVEIFNAYPDVVAGKGILVNNSTGQALYDGYGNAIRGGGLILGASGDGVHIYNNDNTVDVFVDNHGTLGAAPFSSGAIDSDTQVQGYVALTNSGGGTGFGNKGIFAYNDGIDVSNIGNGGVTVNNDMGLIVGGAHGIDLQHLGSAVISNVGGNILADDGFGGFGGFGDGIHINHLNNFAYINNAGGTIHTQGSGAGIYILHVSGGGTHINHDNTSGGAYSVVINNANLWSGGNLTRASIVSEYGDGIHIHGVSGGNVYIGNQGDINGKSGDGIHLSAILTDTYIGNFGGGHISSEGSGNAIYANNYTGGSGKVTVLNSGGSITNGDGSYATIYGREIGGEFHITNTWSWAGSGGPGLISHSDSGGSVPLATLASEVVIDVQGQSNSAGDLLIDNQNWSTINGRIYGPGGSTIFNNSYATWNTSGDSDFGAGNGGSGNAVNNSGGYIEIYGDTHFINLDSLNNSGGTIDMQHDRSAGAVVTLTTDGDYHGSWFGNGHGNLYVDAYLKSGGTLTDRSDRLVILGGASGGTAVHVNDLIPGTPATYDASLIQVVTAAQNWDATFYLANGPVQKGLWQYQLEQIGSTAGGYSEWDLFMQPGQEGAELPFIITATQNAWNTEVNANNDHQSDLRGQVHNGGGGSQTAMLDNGNTVTAAADVPTVQPTNGLWTKILGGNSNRTATTTLGLTTYDVSYGQNVMGFVVGADFGHVDSTGGDLLFGVFGGYTDANTNFNISGSKDELTSFTVGGSVTYLKNGFFADATVKGDFGNNDYKNPASNVLSTSSYGGIVETGYRMGMGQAFLEPIASLSYQHTNIASYTDLGTGVTFNPGDAWRGQAGIKAGMSLETSGGKFEPFLRASVVDSFGSLNSVVLNAGPGFTLNDPGTGTYGQVGGGIDFYGSGNFSAFAAGDYAFASNFNNLTGSAGFNWHW